jgi:hypothetical protein|nr:MAG TPA: hypothetical protein [Caudoviricetes sp.]
MREPGIHIYKKTFIGIIDKLGIKISPENINKIFTMAREFTLDHRSVLNDKASITKSANRRTKSTLGDANLLADIIYSVRIKLKHIGITKIKQSDPQWVQIKELVPTVNLFCDTFKLTKRDGYIKFVEIGLNLMSKSRRPNFNYCASWILKYADVILRYYEAEILLSEDEYPQETREIYNIYINKILEMTGITNNYINNPTEYVNFLWARKMADDLGVDHKTFIDAQFDALAFCNGIPKIEDLKNEKAQQRLTQYISKNGLILHPKNETSFNNSIWDSFKK